MIKDKTSIYMSMVYLVAMQSKDQSTWIGAVIVGPDNEIRSTGYNGLPRGCNDDVDARQVRPEKYYWFEHAERNAIYNAARMGLSVKDCVMYTQGTPCADCARAVIQAGIGEVVIHMDWEKNNSEKWVQSGERSRLMLSESGVILTEWNGDILRVRSCKRGRDTLENV